MPLIKASQSAPLLKDAIVLDLGDLSRQAVALREAAEAKARQIISGAQAEGRRQTADAHEQGLVQGRAEGLKQGLDEGRRQGRAEALQQSAEQLKAIAQSWSAAAAKWEEQRETLHRQARTAVLELALKLGEKVTHRVIEVDRTAVVDQLAEVLSHILRPMDLSIHINPADRPALEEGLPQLMAEFQQFKHIRLMDDPAVGSAGCVVHCGQGRIDATVETQLQRIVELLLPKDTAVKEPPATDHDAT
jgi:flagellar assembly protein FliH